MVRLKLIVLFLFAVIHANSQMKPLKGSGKLISRTYNFSGFNAIRIDNLDGNVEIVVGSTYSVQTTIDDNLDSLIRIDVQDQELVIAITDNKNNRRYIENSSIAIRITLPGLVRLDHRGNSNTKIVGILGESLSVRKSGNGDCYFEGNVTNLDIRSYGNGNTNAGKLVAGNVKVMKTGNGDVIINTVAAFEAGGSGNGDIINRGTGKSTGNISGNGEIINSKQR